MKKKKNKRKTPEKRSVSWRSNGVENGGGGGTDERNTKKNGIGFNGFGYIYYPFPPFSSPSSSFLAFSLAPRCRYAGKREVE